MGRNILVVSTVHDAKAALSPYIDDDDTIKVVVPVVRQGRLDWLANDERAYVEADQAAAETADHLPGETAESAYADSDLKTAVEEALATFAADEVIVAVRPEPQELAVESAATENAPRQEMFGVPVRHVVIGG